LIVLDSHVWVWWVSGVEPLSRRATRAIEQAVTKNAVYISSISAWEIAHLVSRKRLTLTLDVEEWVRRSERLPFVRFVEVSNSIGMSSVRLAGQFHKDPADRIIVATALALGFPVVTKDDKIRNYSHVESIW
jgi:PIN domain nuclease of toxin-antitoxin system